MQGRNLNGFLRVEASAAQGYGCDRRAILRNLSCLIGAFNSFGVQL